MRVVLDTNVFVSGLLSSTSKPAVCVEDAIRHHRIILSRATLRELQATLLQRKFDRYVSRERRERLFDRLAPLVEVVEPLVEIVECRDPSDNAVLEAAVSGHAELIVTRDADLLSLDPFRGIPILTPASYLSRERPR